MSGLPDWRAVSISTAGYEDGLGRRSVRFDREVGGMLECLHLRAELGAFEASLRERAAVMTMLDDERFVRLRSIERTPHGLLVVSELVPGQRLVDIIETRQKDDSAAFGIDAAFGFLLQALPALSALHAAGIAHGTVAPGRIVITPTAQIVLLDGIYGAALERLNLKRAVVWTSLGIIAPPSAGPIRFDRQTDIGQAAICGLFLALGHQADRTSDSSSLARLAREVGELAEIRAGAEFAAGVQQFFSATLPLAGRRVVISIDDAAAEASRLASLIGEEGCHAAFVELTRLDPGAARVSEAADAEPFDDELEAVEAPVVVAAPAARKREPARALETPPAIPAERPVPPAPPKPLAAPPAFIPPPPPVAVDPPVPIHVATPPPPAPVTPAIPDPPAVTSVPALVVPVTPAPVPVPTLAPVP
ncbi:MAG TPA: hypothetical protein VJ813_17760, partial [Vicinamibacterales bacterium]|nr:hypothetical protein [Vicinamibacterales bacterium]